MNAVEINDYARQLYASEGPKALAEAAEMVRRYAQCGDKGLADDWRRIQAALRELRGPIAS